MHTGMVGDRRRLARQTQRAGQRDRTPPPQQVEQRVTVDPFGNQIYGPPPAPEIQQPHQPRIRRDGADPREFPSDMVDVACLFNDLRMENFQRYRRSDGHVRSAGNY